MPVSSFDSASSFKVWEIKTLGKSKDAEARRLLESIAKQVQPIMIKRRWRVKLLKEFIPGNPTLLGCNYGEGSRISIRLRPHGRMDEFYPYEELLGTMLHELVHNEHGPHNAAFYKLLDEITTECEELMAKGISGTGVGFDGLGKRLGGYTVNPPLSSLRQKALDAATKRAKLSSILPNGPKRLGGDNEISKLLTPAQAAAMAAERRLRDDIWCPGSESCPIDPEEETSVLGSVSSLTNMERPSEQTSIIERPTPLREDTSKHSSDICTRETSASGSTSSLIKAREVTNVNERPSSSGNTLQTSSTISREESSWDCSVCTLKNMSWALVCDACGNQRPIKNSQVWSCKFCTLHNPVAIDKCSACGEWRFSNGPPVLSRTFNHGT